MIKKYGHIMQVNVIGTDDQGRTLVVCPSPGCGDTAYIDDDGRLVCPTGEAINEYLRPYLAILDSEVNACFDI